MARLILIGDIHESLDRLTQVVDALAGVHADGVLMAGDIAEAGKLRMRSPERTARWRDFVTQALDLVGRLGLPLLWVPGNHDSPLWSEHPSNIDRRASTLAGLSVFGIGGAGPEHFGFQHEWDEVDIDRLRVPRVDILLSHTPPLGTLDRTHHAMHVGSRAIQTHANQARVLVCGHIHEAVGVEQLGTCVVINAGSLGAPFACPQFTLLTMTPDRVDVEQRNMETSRVSRYAFDVSRNSLVRL